MEEVVPEAESEVEVEEMRRFASARSVLHSPVDADLEDDDEELAELEGEQPAVEEIETAHFGFEATGEFAQGYSEQEREERNAGGIDEGEEEEEEHGSWPELPQAASAVAAVAGASAVQMSLGGSAGTTPRQMRREQSSPQMLDGTGTLSARGSPGCFAATGSVRSMTSSGATQQVRMLMHRRLFCSSGSLGDSSGGSAACSPSLRRKPNPAVMSRLLAKKERRDGPLSPEHTFKPHISEASRRLSSNANPEEKRWQTLSKVDASAKEQKLQEARDQNIQRELAQCTFSPEVSQASNELVKRAAESGRLKRWNTQQQQPREETTMPTSPAGASDTLLLGEEGAASAGSPSSPGALGSTTSSLAASRLLAGTTGRVHLGRGKPGAFGRQLSAPLGGRGRGEGRGKDADRLKVDLTDPLFDELHEELMALVL